MKRFFYSALILALFLTANVFAQGTKWEFIKAFPDTNLKMEVHGIAVDPNDRVWIQTYDKTDSILDATSGKYATCRKILVYNHDGTPAPFNGFKTITVGGVSDTMWNSQVGLRTEPTGNILLCTYSAMYRVNYQDASGMNKVIPFAGYGLTAPGVDTLGDIFVTTVLPGNPLALYDAGFNYTGNILDTVYNYGRSVNVSPDGATVYLTRYSGAFLNVYHSDNGTFGPYTLQDSTFIGMAIECSGWNKKDGYLYISSGGQVPSIGYGNLMFYAWDTKANKLVDSIVWNQTVSPGDCRPRAIDFSVTGDTAYVGEFGTNGVPSVQMFARVLTSVEPLPGSGIPADYKLSQNYPNPFNPTTDIQYSIPRSGFTTLRVYDILGREVATLVNENLNPGSYKATFNAGNLASGTYIYELTSGTTRIVKTMMLIK